MDNYELSRNRAQAYFLNFDQETLIRTWNLRQDADRIYVDFFGCPYGICRKTGTVTRLPTGEQAGFEEVLSIFDLLCHEGTEKQISGAFAPVNSLKGCGAVGVATGSYTKTASVFDADPEGFRRACLGLGSVPVEMGDMAFRFPVFGGLSVILKFYHADEDFPASITLLWDENTLQFVYYETVFYMAGFLLERIRRKM